MVLVMLVFFFVIFYLKFRIEIEFSCHLMMNLKQTTTTKDRETNESEASIIK